MVSRGCERASWVGLWECIIRGSSEGIQWVIWNNCCSRCKNGVLLPKVAQSRWHSLRAGWWDYHILIVLFGGGIGKADIGYKDFADAIEKCIIWRFWWRGGGRGDRFSGDHRKVEYVKTSMEGREGRMYRLWGGHTKAEFVKAAIGSVDFCFCDLLKELIKSH